MLSKKYYKEIAELLRTTETKQEIIYKLIVFFSRNNPKFNQIEFETAIFGKNKLEEPPKEETIQIPYYTKD
jgi:hypothetical protein